MPSVWHYVFWSFRVFYICHRPWDNYKITQNSLDLNAHNKTKISMLISVWTNPIASFIFVEGSMAKMNTCRYFVPGFYWGICREKFCLKIWDSGMPTSCAVSLSWNSPWDLIGLSGLFWRKIIQDFKTEMSIRRQNIFFHHFVRL